MSITEQFWQYAKQAILSAAAAKTDEDRQSLLDLARTWTQAESRLGSQIMACRTFADTHSLKTTVAMMTRRINDT
jgi:hypothetical protein